MLAKFDDGGTALSAAGQHHYLACWPDEALLHATLKLVCSKAGVTTLDLPAAIRLRRRGGLLFAFNYGDDAWRLPGDHAPLLGATSVTPQGVAIFEDPTPAK